MEIKNEVALKNYLNSPDPRERRDAINKLADYKVSNALGLLIRQLNYQDASVRSAAAAALGKLGDKKAVRQLIRLLSSSKEDLTVRSAAATALGELGDGQALEPLIMILKEEQSSLRQVAAIALGKLGHLKAVEPLIRAMRDDDSFVREAAATGLAMLGEDIRKIVTPLRDLKSFDSGQRREAVTELGKSQNQWARKIIEEILLTDVDYTVRRVAAESLRSIGEKHSIQVLSKALGDIQYEVRKAAADALEYLGEEMGTFFLNALEGDEQALEVLVRKYSNQLVESLIFVQRDKSENSNRIQENARKAIRKIGKSAIGSLVNLLGIQDESVRQAVISAFVAMGKESVAPLSNVIRRSNNFKERINAAIVLGKLKDPSVVNTLLRMLHSPSPHERAEACIALGEIGDKQAVADLIKVVESNNESPNVKREAARALGRFGDETRTIEPLIKLLKDQDASVRDAAEIALKEFGESAVESLISKLNKEEDPSLRKRIIDLLAALKASKAIGPLIDALKDKEAHLTIAAARALSEIGDSQAIEPIFETFERLDSERKKVWDQDKAKVYESLVAKVFESLIKASLSDIPSLFKILQDKPSQLRIDTIYALGKAGDNRAVSSLIAILQEDKELEVRKAAATALGRIGDPSAIGPLEEVQKEEINFMKKILSPRVAKNLRSLKNIAETAKTKIQENQQMIQSAELN